MVFDHLQYSTAQPHSSDNPLDIANETSQELECPVILPGEMDVLESTVSFLGGKDNDKLA